MAWLIGQRLTAGEAGVDVVPEADRWAFSEAPAEKDHAPLEQRGKIDQAVFEALDVYPHRGDLVDACREVRGQLLDAGLKFPRLAGVSAESAMTAESSVTL